MAGKSDDVVGRGSARAMMPIIQALRALVSNMLLAPLVPRASKLMTAAAPCSRFASAVKASAPISPDSSASVIRKTIGLRKRSPRSARAVSTRVATPMPSSEAPGPAGTES